MRRALLWLAASVACLAATAAPVAAATDPIALSWDGRAWSTDLVGTLFSRPGSIEQWVPGDSDTETFYVRDQGGDAARLTLDYDLAPNALLSPADLTLSVSVDGGSWQTLAPSTDWVTIAGSALGDGDETKVQVKAVFDPASSNQSQGRALPVDLRVGMAELPGPAADNHRHPADGAAPGPGAGTGRGGDAGNAGWLANTGAPAVRWAVGAGLVCLGGGLAVVAASRRKEKRDAEAS